MMDALLQDIRFAVRSLLKSPGFTIVAVLTLALGIGATTAVFSVIYGVLLRPLPYPEPDRIVRLGQVYQQYHGEMSVTYRQFLFLHENARVFESSAAAASVGLNLYTGNQSARVDALRVSRDYFRVLGVNPEIGRTFTAEEDAEGGPGALILSHGLWQRLFGADRTAVGTSVSVDGRPSVIVGVMPAGFGTGEEAWSTLAQVGRTIGSGQNLEFVARLQAGVSLEAANAGLAPTIAGFREQFAEQVSKDMGVEIVRMQDQMVGEVKTPLTVLLGAIGLVLLIACANVANLVLGRTAARGREIAVRVALGASRGRVARQLLTESVVLALLGGGLGLLVAAWSLNTLLALAPASLTTAGEIRLDGWALAFTACASLATGVLFGLAPAWRAARRDLHEDLKAAAGRTTGGLGQGRLRGALVVGEVALSLVLLAGSGLLIQSIRNLVRINPGFDSRNLLTAEIWLTGSGRDSTAQITALYDELGRRLAALPGVRAAAVVEAGMPLERGGNMPFGIDGKNIEAAVEYRTVTPGYLGLLGVPLQWGRNLTASDGAGAEPVVVVNRAFVKRYFGDSLPVGHTVTIGRQDAPRRIVGMVGDVRSTIGRDAAPGVFITSAQTPAGLTRLFGSWFPIHVVIRTAGDPAALRDALGRTIRDVDSRVPVGRVRTMDEVLAGSLAFQRFLMLLLSVFAGLAVVLAAVGLYGVMSALVTQRTREIGLRMALGAARGDVLRLVVGKGMLLAGIGAVIGVAGALAATRLIREQLYGVTPGDPRVIGVVTALLLAVAALACGLPARRATRVDPMVALRSE